MTISWNGTAIERSRVLTRVFRSQLRMHYAKKDAAEDAASLAHLQSRQFRPDAVLIQISRLQSTLLDVAGGAPQVLAEALARLRR